MKLVQFKNGKFGIRKLTILGYRFLSKNYHWWPKHYGPDFNLEHTEEEAVELLCSVNDKGTPINH